MKTSDFYYDLPKELIAQDPLEDRSSSRLLVLHRKSGRVEHRVFTDIVEYLKPGDCLVRNNTKVIPARLYGTRVDTGATIELLLLKRMENDVWETLVKPGKKARKGAVISFGDGIYSLNMYINLFHINSIGNRGDGLTCMKEIFVLLIRKPLLQINW